MTANQIRYADHLESKRHNVQQEAIGFGTLGESRRHNVASESLGWGNLAELGRSNLEREAVSWHQADTARITAEAREAEVPIRQQEADTKELGRKDQFGYWVTTTNIKQQEADVKSGELQERKRHQLYGDVLSTVDTGVDVIKILPTFKGLFSGGVK